MPPVYFQGVQSLRQVGQWSNQLLWDVRFFNPKPEPGQEDSAETLKKLLPKPFDQWFPAMSVEDQTADLESYTMETAFKPLFFPKSGGKKTVKLSFVDDAAHKLHQFFETWIEETIQNNDTYVATITESVKFLQVVRLDNQRLAIADQVKTYCVYPESPLVYEGSDKPDPNSYTITFVKCGIAPNGTL